MGFGDDLGTWTDQLDLLRTNLDAGRQVARVEALVTTIALVHHAVAGILRQQVQVQAHAGLALGDVPGADSPALGAAHAPCFVNGNGAFPVLLDDTEGADGGARRP